MAYSEQVLRAHVQGRQQQQAAAAPPSEAALRKEKAKKLGLKEDATPDEVKAAFRRLSLKYHPDRHVSATPDKQKRAAERYREITEAYHWLQSRERKAA
jgi:DnaJ-domain-containing protein 1